MASTRDTLMKKIVALQRDYGDALMEQSKALNLEDATVAAASFTLAHVVAGIWGLNTLLKSSESEGE
jgi:hypothetical protein